MVVMKNNKFNLSNLHSFFVTVSSKDLRSEAVHRYRCKSPLVMGSSLHLLQTGHRKKLPNTGRLHLYLSQKTHLSGGECMRKSTHFCPFRQNATFVFQGPVLHSWR